MPITFSNRLDAAVIFILFVLAAMSPSVPAATVDLPGVEVDATASRSNGSPVSRPLGLTVPRGAFGDEEGRNIVIFDDQRGGRQPLGTADRKNALFLIEYGLYDFLNSSLTFANQFGPASYLFSFNRRSVEDVHAGGRRVYNSQNSLDHFDLNLQVAAGSAANSSRLQYFKDERGLQRNSGFYLQNKKLILLSDLLTLKFRDPAKLEFGIGVDLVDDAVKNNLSAVNMSYTRVRAQARFRAAFSDVNSYYLLARADYENLSHPSNTDRSLRAGVEAFDNFMLWSIVGFDLKAGLFWTRDGLRFFPSISVAYALSEIAQLKAYSALEDAGLFLTDFIRRYDYLSPAARLPARTVEWSSGVSLDALLFAGSSLSLDCRYVSASRRFHLALSTAATQLYEIRGVDADSVRAGIALSLRPVKALSCDLTYQFVIFEREIDLTPRHDLTVKAGVKIWGFDLIGSFRYFSAMTVSSRFLPDFADLGFELRREISRNMTASLRAENVLDRRNEFYAGYVERGFLLSAGFKVNLY